MRQLPSSLVSIVKDLDNPYPYTQQAPVEAILLALDLGKDTDYCCVLCLPIPSVDAVVFGPIDRSCLVESRFVVHHSCLF
jgi:hypothetical protein